MGYRLLITRRAEDLLDNLVVLNRTDMPAVLVEVGFINTDADNQLLDERFYDVAQAIADGILQTIQSA